jgi:hypothetical protein
MNTPTPTCSLARSIALALATLTGAVTMAHADSGRRLPPTVPPAYTQECGSCHTAYPPGMLPAESWQRTMAGLDRHFGTDASLDAAAQREIGSWLRTHAGTMKRAQEAPPQDRITRSAWFDREHRKVEPAVWRHASVKSAANCGACHAGADRGDYDEDQLRLPAGLDARHLRSWRD